MGNIMNGGTQKGQADGFYLEALSKATTMKDINGRTMMQIICEKMKAEDEEFLNFKNGFKNMYFVIQYSLKEEDTKIKEIKQNYDKAEGNYNIVEKLLAGEPLDGYCIKIKEFLGEAKASIQEMERNLAGLQKRFTEAVDFYLIDKSDEKAGSSQEFFKFFTQFIDLVVKSMPKEEKKRTVNAGAKVGVKSKV